LLAQEARRAFSRALANTGNRIEARIAIMAMTTSNSIKVKPRLRVVLGVAVVVFNILILQIFYFTLIFSA
jgi:hypothetical protein